MSEAVMCDQGNLLTRGLGRRKSLEKGAMLLEENGRVLLSQSAG